jgi:hypothetical protein
VLNRVRTGPADPPHREARGCLAGLLIVGGADAVPRHREMELLVGRRTETIQIPACTTLTAMRRGVRTPQPQHTQQVQGALVVLVRGNHSQPDPDAVWLQDLLGEKMEMERALSMSASPGAPALWPLSIP